MQHRSSQIALMIFAGYVGLLPGSSFLVATDMVPAWGLGFGGILLILQGAAMLAWLFARYRLRGLIVGLTVALLGFGIEYIGVKTGFPFGHYRYTDLVQPQLFGNVPIAICLAWMMTAVASYEIARLLVASRWGQFGVVIAAGTLVLVQDLQIETVAALINNYWQWEESGPYYGIPTTNFVAWWLFGLAMSWLIVVLLAPAQPTRWPFAGWLAWVLEWMPLLLYTLSSAMFMIINLARGYVLAGLIGVMVVLAASLIIAASGEFPLQQTARRQFD